MMKEVTFDITNELSELSLGQCLTRARLARTLSLQQVAERLRLPLRVIAALENDDFTSHPGITFMRGYLSSYARLLGLNEQQVASKFASLGLKQHTLEISPMEPIYCEGASFAERYLRIITFFVLFVLIGLVMVWWLNHNPEDISNNPATLASRNSTIAPKQAHSTIDHIDAITATIVDKQNKTDLLKQAVVNDSLIMAFNAAINSTVYHSNLAIAAENILQDPVVNIAVQPAHQKASGKHMKQVAHTKHVQDSSLMTLF